MLTRGPLDALVPIENAAMPHRTVIQWDKDDLDALGLLKVDVLGLGMLTALSKALALVGRRRGHAFGLHDIPAEDPATYDMICRADTVGVFQIESRAQQAMLPRLKPRCFYDLVIEVAIVRPGPIQGGMVHPYLARREGREPVDYPGEALKEALGRTLGVPLFQEQVMQVAIVAAGFTPGEADGLRRAMAAWRSEGRAGAVPRAAGAGHGLARLRRRRSPRRSSSRSAASPNTASRRATPPRSPSSSTPAAGSSATTRPSSWRRMLNSQPLGFYSPSQLVQDARRHGVEVRPADVLWSRRDCTLEDLPHPPAVRLGLRLVAGLGDAAAARIEAARDAAPFESADDLARRAGLGQRELRLLAAADALASLSGHRRQQVWEASALVAPPLLLRDAPVDEAPLELPPAPEGEEIVFDYAALGLTLRRHPLALLRPRLARRGLLAAGQLAALPDGRAARACGIVTLRQQPDTAGGTMFVSLEDETGSVQVVVWRRVRDAQRRVLLGARLLAVHGVWQRRGEVAHLVAGRLDDLTPLLGRLGMRSRDFR